MGSSGASGEILHAGCSPTTPDAHIDHSGQIAQKVPVQRLWQKPSTELENAQRSRKKTVTCDESDAESGRLQGFSS
jgi:hypothetical protein